MIKEISEALAKEGITIVFKDGKLEIDTRWHDEKIIKESKRVC